MVYLTSALEMLMLGFDYLDFTEDEAFLEKYLVPLAPAVIEFFPELGSYDERGVYHLVAHSTETYHRAHDPTPDMAGLRGVLPRMLEKFPGRASAEQMTKWRRLLAALPPLTFRDAREKIPMLLQWDGRTIHLLPAWPKERDVHFKLNAPFDTTVEGTVIKGELSFLRVTPPKHAADVLLNPEFNHLPTGSSDSRRFRRKG